MTDRRSCNWMWYIRCECTGTISQPAKLILKLPTTNRFWLIESRIGNWQLETWMAFMNEWNESKTDSINGLEARKYRFEHHEVAKRAKMCTKTCMQGSTQIRQNWTFWNAPDSTLTQCYQHWPEWLWLEWKDYKCGSPTKEKNGKQNCNTWHM